MSQQTEFAGVPVIQFIQNETFTTFKAEYGFDVNDIVYHFFRTKEFRNNNKFWKDTFPKVLSEVAVDQFKVPFPRVKAAYTAELDSWWMRATGFVDIGDPDARSERFFEELDKALEQANATPAPQ